MHGEALSELTLASRIAANSLGPTLKRPDTCLCLPRDRENMFCFKMKPKDIRYRWGGGNLLSSGPTPAGEFIFCWVSYLGKSAEAGNAILQSHVHSNSTGTWPHGHTSPRSLQSGRRCGFLSPGTGLKAQERQFSTVCDWNHAEISTKKSPKRLLHEEMQHQCLFANTGT